MPSSNASAPERRQRSDFPVQRFDLQFVLTVRAVVTAAVYGSHWKVDASAFNGREPDERRYNVESARLDSWSGRVTVAPNHAEQLRAACRCAEHAIFGDHGQPLGAPA